MAIINYVRNGRRFGDRKMLTGAKIPKMSLQAYEYDNKATRSTHVAHTCMCPYGTSSGTLR